MVEIKAELTPMRLKFGKDKSIELMIQITNDGEKARFTSLDIILSNHLAFDKTGRQNSIVKRFGELKVGEKKLLYLDIYPKMSLNKGDIEPIFITAMEHYQEDYDYVLSKKTKQLDLRIE